MNPELGIFSNCRTVCLRGWTADFMPEGGPFGVVFWKLFRVLFGRESRIAATWQVIAGPTPSRPPRQESSTMRAPVEYSHPHRIRSCLLRVQTPAFVSASKGSLGCPRPVSAGAARCRRDGIGNYRRAWDLRRAVIADVRCGERGRLIRWPHWLTVNGS